jgi:hypothetical protein
LDAARQKFSVNVDGVRVVNEAEFAEPSETFGRVSIRIWGRADAKLSVPVPPELDQPSVPCAYLLRDVRIETIP